MKLISNGLAPEADFALVVAAWFLAAAGNEGPSEGCSQHCFLAPWPGALRAGSLRALRVFHGQLRAACGRRSSCLLPALQAAHRPAALALFLPGAGQGPGAFCRLLVLMAVKQCGSACTSPRQGSRAGVPHLISCISHRQQQVASTGCAMGTTSPAMPAAAAVTQPSAGPTAVASSTRITITEQAGDVSAPPVDAGATPFPRQGVPWHCPAAFAIWPRNTALWSSHQGLG